MATLRKNATLDIDNAVFDFADQFSSEKKTIYKVCVTGGPCAGKTTAMAEISKYFGNYGFKVFIVPETATLTMCGGGDIVVSNKPFALAVQREIQIIKMQKSLENYFKELSKLGEDKKSIVLFDRGCMDARAYIDDEL